jgi:hypothetical protein
MGTQSDRSLPGGPDVASALASGEATVSRSTIDSALIGNLFDGNTNTVAKHSMHQS